MSNVYQSAAAHYLRGRPPYSAELAARLRQELALDGSGRLLDVGCGPGVLTLELAPLFVEAVGLDPEPRMLEIARQRGQHIRWVEGKAEDIAALDLPRPFRLVTFGQSFHWVEDRKKVAETIFDILEPGGALALISPRPRTDKPDGPGYPEVPLTEIRRLAGGYIAKTGPVENRATFEESLAGTSFGPPRKLVCPGREDLVQSVDEVVSYTFSQSAMAPDLFGARLAEFEAELRRLLGEGPYWHWPGDTEVLLAVKSR